jgi:hypothetical protein
VTLKTHKDFVRRNAFPSESDAVEIDAGHALSSAEESPEGLLHRTDIEPTNCWTVLHLPVHLATEFQLRFKDGIIEHAWEEADRRLSMAARRRSDAARKQRDELRASYSLPGDQILLGECSTATNAVGTFVRNGTSAEIIGIAANAVARRIIAALRKDPMGAPDLTDLLDGLADVLTERPDTHFCTPQIQSRLALEWANDGERGAGLALLDSTISVVEEILREGISPLIAARNLAVAHLAKADICNAAEQPEACLVAASRGWEWSQFADAACRSFAIERYYRVLRNQHHPECVITAAADLVRHMRAEAGNVTDWVFLDWPELPKGENTMTNADAYFYRCEAIVYSEIRKPLLKLRDKCGGRREAAKILGWNLVDVNRVLDTKPLADLSAPVALELTEQDLMRHSLTDLRKIVRSAVVRSLEHLGPTLHPGRQCKRDEGKRTIARFLNQDDSFVRRAMEQPEWGR